MVNTNADKQQPSDTRWPFPTKDNPLKPWTPKEVKDYNQLQRAKVVEQLRKAPDAPM